MQIADLCIFENFVIMKMLSIFNEQEHLEAQISDKAAHYPVFARICDLDNQHGDPDHPQNSINCSLYHCRAILEIAEKSTYNLLNNGWVSDLTVSMVI